MPNLLIVGVGYLGGALARRRLELLGPRWQVWGLTRRPHALPAGLLPWAADLTAAPLPPPPARFDRVLFAAAPDQGDEGGYQALYVGGVAALTAALAAARQQPPLVFTSSTSVWAEDQGGWVDEQTPATGVGWRGAALLRAERQAAALPLCRLRLAGLYGPGRCRPLAQLRQGTARWPAMPRWSNRIHVDDAAALAARLLCCALPPAVVLGVDGEPARNDDVLAFVASLAGLPVPGPRPRPSAMPEGKRCRSVAISALRFDPRYPSYREGFAAIIGGA